MNENEKIEVYKDYLKDFSPLTNEQQELLLFMVLDSMDQLTQKSDELKAKKQTKAVQNELKNIAVQLTTYIMFMNLLTKDKLKLQKGVVNSFRDFFFKEIAKQKLDYEKFCESIGA